LEGFSRQGCAKKRNKITLHSALGARQLMRMPHVVSLCA